MRYLGRKAYRHDEREAVGVLVTNLGTPDEPTPGALRRYLKQFLWDPRVVEIPRPIWWLILHLIVLRVRPAKSARVYQKIWSRDGSPLLIHSRLQVAALEHVLASRSHGVALHLECAMRYGNPSIESAIESLYNKGVTKLLLLPLYPQYSGSTTGSTLDAVFSSLKKLRWVPELRTINGYADHEQYIRACAQSIQQHWGEHGRAQKLVMSFHGLPKRYLLSGDPYFCQCHKTARLIAEALDLNKDQWAITFQSRFGKAEWLKPYTDQYLQSLPEQGVKSVDLVCPGFSADCVETLEEIDMQNREFFLSAGGEKFSYIAALNERDEHIDCLVQLIEQHTCEWSLHGETTENLPSEEELQLRRKRAMTLGAKK